jgi:hypothetical protein
MRSFVPQIAEESLQTRNCLKTITRIKKKRILNEYVKPIIALLSYLLTTKKTSAKGVRESGT